MSVLTTFCGFCYISLINHVNGFDYICLPDAMGKKYRVFQQISQVFLQVRAVRPNITGVISSMKSAQWVNA